MDEIAQRIVSDLEPAAGWWKGGTEDTLLEVTEELLSEGCDEQVVEDGLRRVIGAMREEYGD
jgi:hypothetical protein